MLARWPHVVPRGLQMRALAAVIAAGLLVFGWTVLRGQEGNCGRIHKVVATIDTIIDGGAAQVENYRREGLLTDAQADRALRFNAHQRRLMQGADCVR